MHTYLHDNRCAIPAKTSGRRIIWLGPEKTSNIAWKIIEILLKIFSICTWKRLTFMGFAEKFYVNFQDKRSKNSAFPNMNQTHLAWTPVTNAPCTVCLTEWCWLLILSLFSCVFIFIRFNLSPPSSRSQQLLCYCHSFFFAVRLSSFPSVLGQQFVFGCSQSVCFYRWTFWSGRIANGKKEEKTQNERATAAISCRNKRQTVVIRSNHMECAFGVYISQFHILTDMSECAGPRNSTHSLSLAHTRTHSYHNNEIKYLYPTDNVMS